MARPQAAVGAPRESKADADYRRRLLAVRDDLEATLAECGPREKAPLVARYLDVLDKLAALPEVVEVDVVDEFTARRARTASAARQERPAPGRA